MRSNWRALAVATLTLTALTALAACGGSGGTGTNDDPVAGLAVQYDKVLGDKAVKLDVSTHPKAPAGFTDGDVNAFAKLLVSLAERGMSTKASEAKSADAAIKYAMADLNDKTTSAFVPNAKEYLDKMWALPVVDRYGKEGHGATRLVKYEWKTSSETQSDGSVMTLTLWVVTVRDFDTKKRTPPVVTSREYTLRGYDPDNSNYWPGFEVSFDIFGNDGCAAFLNGQLAPNANPKELRVDQRNLKAVMAGKPLAEKSSEAEVKDYQANCKAKAKA